MSDRIKGFTVALEHDLKDEDAEAIVKAIEMIRGVVIVIPVTTKSEDHINRAQIRLELRSKIMDILTKD